MADFAAWYRRVDYQRIRQIMNDGHEFPGTFDQWEQAAKRQMARAKAAGVVLKPVILDPDEFITFCNVKNLPQGSQARALFGIDRGLAKGMN
jgi:hypothetical protein